MQAVQFPRVPLDVCPRMRAVPVADRVEPVSVEELAGSGVEAKI